MEELTTTDTLHDDVDPLARLVEALHLHDIRVGNHADNLQLTAQELLLLVVQLCLVNFFDCADLARDFVPRVKDICEFSTSDATDLLVGICRRE